MKAIRRDRSFQLSIILTFIFFGTGIAFVFTGLGDYNWILFALLPVVLGIAIGAMPHPKYTLTGCLLAAIISLMGLYVPGLSGLLCIIMALPIIVPFIFLGYVITHLVMRYREIRETNK